MNNRTKLLNSLLDQAQELNDRGDTASASSIIAMVSAECAVILADKLSSIEKHLASLVNHESKPVILEKVTKAKG